MMGGGVKATVLFYITLLSATGGGQHALSLLALELAARGHGIGIFTRPPFDRRHRYARWLSSVGIPVGVWPWFEIHWLARLGASLAAGLLSVPYAIVRRRPVTFAWGAARSIFLSRVARLERWYVGRHLARSLLRGKVSGAGVVLHIWGPAAFTPFLLEWAQANDVPAIYHEMAEADERIVADWALEPTLRELGRARRVICASRSVAETLRRVYGYDGALLTVPFMVRGPSQAWREPPRRGSRVTFGAIGRLVPHKRHEDLLHALRRLRDDGHDVALVIAGEGPSRSDLERLARDLGLAERTTFTGEFESLEEVMGLFDVFVLVSASESQCMPITESMAFGKPVVASRFGGIPDFVEDGVTGLLVPVGDVGCLVETLKKLVLDPSLREEMGRRGRERYVERYGAEKIADAIERAYEEICREAPGADGGGRA